MAQAIVERQRREMKRGPLIATVGVVGSLLLGMLMLMPLYGRPNYEVGLYDTTPATTAVMVRGQRWQAGDRVVHPDASMVAVGRTDEGHLLYVNAHANYGGGGGGAPERNGDVTRYTELFVRNAQNSYTRVK